MLTPPVTAPSLRRTLIASALVVVVAATTATLVALYVTLSMRDAIDRDSVSLMEEQRIADRIVTLAHQQQLDAFRYLQQPDDAHRRAFDARGDSAHAQMQTYLFRDLSTEARLQVQRMKEAHESFEVTAHRSMDLAQRGDARAAAARASLLAGGANSLESTVTDFLDARIAQRAALQKGYLAMAARARAGLVLMGVLLMALVAALARSLRRRVLDPLQELATVAQRISAGDAAARVAPPRYVELATVASAFNEMADSVQVARETTEMNNEELRQSLDQLQQTQDELVQHEKLSAMGQMLAGLAHELNNPLAGVLGMAELLREELAASPDAAVRSLGTELALPLAHEAERARDLVRNLLSFSRKSSDALGPVALSAAVRIAMGLRSSAFAHAGKRLTMDISPALYVHAEAQKLEHVILNVVNNALDALTGGGGTELTIRARALDGDSVELAFEDDGPGFTRPEAAFDAFYTTKPAERGTGLGLTLVQKFVHEFGGAVSAANRPGGGARVTVILRRAADPSEIESAIAATRAATPPLGVAAVGMNGNEPRRSRPRILVVDDEASLREVQRRLLLLENYDVLLASSGEEARRIVSSEDVDLVISDLRMPGHTDGRGLHAWLAAQHPNLAQHMLVVTGDTHGVPGDLALDMPEERVLAKPFTREEYITRVRAAIARLG